MDKQYDFLFSIAYLSLVKKKGEKDNSRVHGRRCLSCVAGLLGQQNYKKHRIKKKYITSKW